MQQRILIIEDESDIAESLQYNFVRDGFQVQIAESGEKGLRIALEMPPNLIVLDIMLPGMNGIELCRRFRREPQTKKTPIIMLTAKVAESDKVNALEIGADDYIVKPFSVKEVMARVRAVLRRVETDSSENYKDERILIDFEDMRVVCFNEEVRLTKKEFALFSNLVKNSGRISTRQNLLDNVWGYSYYGDTRTLDVHIRRLRSKLGECGNCIETVVGIGYRFVVSK
jgi:two-component system, OmpR family, alkaline phosphatase synthesis response regulator PhoP